MTELKPCRINPEMQALLDDIDIEREINKIKADAIMDALAYAQTKCNWRTATHYRAVEFSRAVEEYANKLREQGE